MKLLKILVFFPIILFSRDQLGILDFEAINVNPIEARALTNALSTEINLISDYKIIKQSEINRRLKNKISECYDNQCAIEIGESIGLQYIVIGSISLLGKTYSIDANMIFINKDVQKKEYRITLKSKTIIYGTIIKESNDNVTVNTDLGEIVIDRNNIQQIVTKDIEDVFQSGDIVSTASHKHKGEIDDLLTKGISYIAKKLNGLEEIETDCAGV